MQSLEVVVKDAPFDPDSNGRVVRTKNAKSDRPLYQVFLYLDGPDLPFVAGVTYELHPTFENPVRTVQRSVKNPRCRLVIWAWGLFDVKATIRDRDGRDHVRTHGLEYDRHFSAPGVQFVET